MNLRLQTRNTGDVVVIHGQGRIVYRDEADRLTQAVIETLRHAQAVVLDLTEVDAIDSAGLGQLVLVHLWARNRGKPLKLAAANPGLRKLLELTNLVSVFELYATLDDALEATEASSLA